MIARRAYRLLCVLAVAVLATGGPAEVAHADDPPVTAPVEELTLPVEELTLPVEDLVFTEGSMDGALTDVGHQEFRLSADVLFAFDKAALTPKATALLAQVAGTLKQQGATRVTVTGFTDATGQEAYNLGLSQRRAQAVVAALPTLVGPGVTLVAAGRGEQNPIADNATKDGQALNRRVEIRVG